MSNYRPPLCLQEVPKLILELYGIRVLVIKEMESYDDRNVLVEVEKNSTLPPHIVSKNITSTRFLLKVHHETYSSRPDILDLKNSLITHLTKAGYPTPCLIHTLEGGFQTVVGLKDPDTGREGKHVVKLFDFHPGITLEKVCLTRGLCHEVGKLTGWMDAIWMGFPVKENKEICELKINWNMSEMSDVRTKLDYVRDKSRIPLIEEVILEFESSVLSSQESFSKGIIHSDINDCNALVQTIVPDADACLKETQTPGQKRADGSSYKVTSIIDFGDLTYSLHIFDLAIAMTYLMLNKDLKPLEIGASVMAGYLEHMPLPRSELIHLHTCICARLVQSFVYGQVALAADENNAEYTQTHAIRCMPMLDYLWTFSHTEFLDQLMSLK